MILLAAAAVEGEHRVGPPSPAAAEIANRRRQRLAGGPAGALRQIGEPLVAEDVVAQPQGKTWPAAPLHQLASSPV